jgi:uncharacterized protein (DUF983 family)
VTPSPASRLALARRLLARALRLLCPGCGAASLFERGFRMRASCPACGLVFEREAGYFVGAIYINYGLTVTIALAGYFLLDAWLAPPAGWQAALWGAFAVLFPLGSFRHSKALWLALDQLIDPSAPRRGGPAGGRDVRLGVALAGALGLIGISLAAAMPNFAASYVASPVPDGGTVTGRVRFAGEPVAGEPIRVRKNVEVCGDSKAFQALIVGSDKGVGNTVVYLEGVTRGKPAPELELDNARCLFVPHVSAVMAGARVRVKNADPVLHNTHGLLDRLTVFNVALPNRDQVVDITQRIKKVGVVEVLCDAHTHMRAWIVVRDNPYFAVTDDGGRFRITDVPPGQYRMVAWHEGWVLTGRDKDGRPVYDAPRVLTREVTVPARGEAAVDFELR